MNPTEQQPGRLRRMSASLDVFDPQSSTDDDEEDGADLNISELPDETQPPVSPSAATATSISTLLSSFKNLFNRDESSEPTGPLSTIAVCRAVFSHQPESEELLHFREGELILVESHHSDEWWTGRVYDTEERGLFPASYVVELSPDRAEHFVEGLFPPVFLLSHAHLFGCSYLRLFNGSTGDAFIPSDDSLCVLESRGWLAALHRLQHESHRLGALVVCSRSVVPSAS